MFYTTARPNRSAVGRASRAVILTFAALAGLILGGCACLLAASHVGAAAVHPTTTAVPLVISHRGYTGTGCTENTVCAVRAAASHGTDMVETDVRFTADGVPVISHDATVDRVTTGRGAVASMTSARFLRLRSRHGGHPATLRQFLAAAQAGRVRALVELKVTPNAAQMRRFNAAVPAGMRPKVTVQSFLASAVAEAHAAGWPAVRLLNTAAQTAGARLYDGAAIQYQTVTAATVRRLNGLHVCVYAWTVDDVASWKRLANAGVDGLITNADPRAVKTATTP